MVHVEDICTARKKLGLSQEKFAEALGVSRNTVSRWERGEFNPTADKLAALEQLLVRLEEPAAPEEKPVPEETTAPKEEEIPSAAVPAKARHWPAALMLAGILCTLLIGIATLIGVCSIRQQFGQTDSTAIRIYDEAELEKEEVDGVSFMEPITLQPVHP